MLSNENPPPDLPCPSEKSSSLLGSGRDDNKNHHCHLLEVDLCKSGLDDNIHIPKFSIRDYVYNARSKDIKNHWPFSSKNLQLCLKHGVKDVLPPFDSVKPVDNSDVKLCEFSDDIKSCGSGEDKKNPTILTSHSKDSVSIIKCPNLPEAENLVQRSSEKPESSILRVSSKKVESNSPRLVNKKCKLIVKLGGSGVEQKGNEDNGPVVSETMASKVCPVCKTFSSSSNTTLNAHIDQCLSGESSVKWTTNSKVIKHRIKPRKTRLMVDVYATALSCTLEDLDKRNGTNWASNLGVTLQDMEVCDEGKNNTSSFVHDDGIGEEGDVYFDSNGTKLRFLSKLNNLQSDLNANSLDNIDKGIKLNKKKHLVHRHKLLKCPSRERSFSPRPDCRYKINRNWERKFPHEEVKKADLAEPVNGRGPVKSDDFGMIKQWVGSKRSGLKKKIYPEHENPKTVRNLQAKSNISLVGEEFVGRNHNLSLPVISDDLSIGSNKRKADLSFSSNDDSAGHPCLRKRKGFSLLECADLDRLSNRNNPMLGKHDCDGITQSKKDGSSVPKFPNGAENHASSRSTKKMRSGERAMVSDGSFVSSRVPLKSKKFNSLKKTTNRAILSGGKQFLTLRKNILSVRHASLSQSKKLVKKTLNFKKPRLHRRPRSDEEAAEITVSADTSKEGATASKDIEKPPECGNRIVEKATDSFSSGNVVAGASDARAQDAALEEVESRDEFVRKPTSELDYRDPFMSFGKSLGSRFLGLTASDVEMDSQHYPDDLVLVGKPGSFCADNGRNGLVTSDAHLMVGVDVIETRGNYFIDVDPIPIPGPPGSFLPSPGRMGSEELPGNSSLTTCRVVSSEDGEHELVDMDSSDSPVSATSFASNSIAVKSDSVSFANLSIRHDTKLDASENNRTDSLVKEDIPFDHTGGADGRPKLDDSNADLISPGMSPGKLKNSHQCCCSRKEGVARKDYSNNHESEFLRRQSTNFLPSLPFQERQTSRKSDDRLYRFNSETLPLKEPTPGAENVVANSPNGNTSVFCPSADAKFWTYGDCETPSPSTSNSVLRLMGKNLMVINKEETISSQTAHLQSSNQNEHLYSRTSSRGPSTIDNFQTFVTPQCLDFSSSGGSMTHAIFRVPELPQHTPGFMISSKNFGESFTPSLTASHDRADRHTFISGQLGPQIRLDGSPIRYKVEKVQTHTHRVKTMDTSVSQHKEIIVIDDSTPDNEGGLVAKASDDMKTAGSPVGVSISRALGYDYVSTNNNLPFHQAQQCLPLSNGSQMVPNANASSQYPSKEMNPNFAKWSRLPDGSNSASHPDPATASFPSTGPLYFSPGFSLPNNFT